MIALIDYGAGNLTSVKKAFAAIGEVVTVPRSPVELEQARAVVVPGVGHFRSTKALEGGWTAAILDFIAYGRPLLGICLGMQWLFEGSDEAPGVDGLGIFPGRVVRLEASKYAVKVPHVGWNSLEIGAPASVAEQIGTGAQAYFTHSYIAPVVADTVAVTVHGAPFTSIVQRGGVAGVQFHPEKSGATGLQVLRNFATLAR